MLETKIETEKIAVNQEQLDILDQLLKPEVQESITSLIEQLPKLIGMVTVLTQTYDLAKAITTDETLKEDTVTTVTEIAAPVVSGAKTITRNILEARDRAEESVETIGLFGLVKMLKDPQMQGLLRFANAFLQVSAEKKVDKN